MTTTDLQTLPKTYDLRRVSAAEPAGDAFLGARLPVSAHPEWRFCRAQVEDLSGTFDSENRHLLVIVLAGRLEVASGDTTLNLATGDRASIAPGTRFDWQAMGAAGWVVNIYEAPIYDATVGVPKKDGPSLQAIAEYTPQDPSAAPAAQLLIGAEPTCSKAEILAAADGKWSAGTWTATPYHRVPVTYDYYEMMQLFEGSVTLFNVIGDSITFEAGDLLLVAKGAEVGWKSTETVRKLWSIYTPDQL